MRPGLYLVATPLGNLGDLSPRARETLSRASFLAGESGDSVKRWLGILAEDQPEGWIRPRLLTYREATRERDAARILALLEEGESVALISDAGTPAISDPGWHLVAQARERGLPVWSVPGPCAATAALAASGFPSRRFHFEGFLPTSGRHKREALQRLSESREPSVLYESPHRLLDTLEELRRELPPQELYLCRELTKRFEEDWRGPLEEAAGVWRSRTVKGEFTLVLSGRKPSEESAETEVPEETLLFLKSLKLPTKAATAVALHFYPKAAKKTVYARLAERDRPERS